MRVSVPTIPQTIAMAWSSVKQPSPSAAIERISEFLAPGNAAVLTGAGVSVDSGIRAYRGRDGRYMNPNYKSVFFLFFFAIAFSATLTVGVQTDIRMSVPYLDNTSSY